MSSSCGSLTTKQRAQIDALKELCTQAEDASGNQSDFNARATQLYAAVKSAEKLWNEEPLPSIEEVALLAERIEIIQLRAFDLPGMCEVKEIAFSFFFSLSPQDRISFLYVNKDWNAAFQEFAQMETHNKVTAHLGCLKHNLAVLDAHLGAPLDQETASSVRWLIRNPIQRTLQNFNHSACLPNTELECFRRGRCGSGRQRDSQPCTETARS